MKRSKWIRQGHRWLAIIFSAIAAGIFTMLGLGREPASWVYFLPLLPLALLVLSGLYLFVLPYASLRSVSRGSGLAERAS